MISIYLNLIWVYSMSEAAPKILRFVFWQKVIGLKPQDARNTFDFLHLWPPVATNIGREFLKLIDKQRFGRK